MEIKRELVTAQTRHCVACQTSATMNGESPVEFIPYRNEHQQRKQHGKLQPSASITRQQSLKLEPFIEESITGLHRDLLKHIIITHDVKTYQSLKGQKLIPSRHLIIDKFSVTVPPTIDLRTVPILAMDYLTAMVYAIQTVCPLLDKAQLTKMGNVIIWEKGSLTLDDMCDNNLVLLLLKQSLYAHASTSIFFPQEKNTFSLNTGNVEAFVLSKCSCPCLCRYIMSIFYWQGKELHFTTSLSAALIDIFPWDFCHMVSSTGQGELCIFPPIMDNENMMLMVPFLDPLTVLTSNRSSYGDEWKEGALLDCSSEPLDDASRKECCFNVNEESSIQIYGDDMTV